MGQKDRLVVPNGGDAEAEFLRAQLLVYYGAADESCAVVERRLPDLLNRLLDATRHGTP